MRVSAGVTWTGCGPGDLKGKQMSTHDDIDIAADRLDGVPAIAAFLGLTERVCRYRLSLGVIPHYREGAIHVASKRSLREHHFNGHKITKARATR